MDTKQLQFSSAGAVTGVVIAQGEPHLMNIPPELLVFNAEAWISSKINNYDEKIIEAKDHGINASYLEVAKGELEAWLGNRENCVPTLPDVAHRVTLPHQIAKDNIYSYIDKIKNFETNSYPEIKNAQFLLLADEVTPKIYGTMIISAAIRHTGNEILGEKLSKEDLDNRIAEAIVEVSKSIHKSKSRIAPTVVRKKKNVDRLVSK